MGRRNAPGSAWNVNLMIDPGTARYFYRVESRSVDARWFFWIDADTGAIVNEYDGLTTGSGIGVLGDPKDLGRPYDIQRVHLSHGVGDGRQTTYDAQNRQKLPGVLATDADDDWITPGTSSPGQRALVDAQFYARVTDDFYLSSRVSTGRRTIRREWSRRPTSAGSTTTPTGTARRWPTATATDVVHRVLWRSRRRRTRAEPRCHRSDEQPDLSERVRR